MIGDTGGDIPGHIHPGSTYQLYGNLTDTSAPASGIASVTGNFSLFDTGVTGAALTAGSYTYNSANYDYRTASLTANATLSSCSYTPTVTATDVAGNSGAVNASTTMVDRDLLDGAVAGDNEGLSVANAGDVNGDGRPDAIVTANLADNNGRTNSGSVWIVFGRTTPGTVDLAALGSGGYRIDGAATGDQAGVAVAGAGDVNGDNKQDMIIGADQTDAGGINSGSAYVVFGKATTTTIDLASLGSNGYAINGAAADDDAGVSVANAGDVNGDGKPDALIRAYDADNNSRADSGSAYIIWGKSGTTAVSLGSLGTAGYRIDGATAGDQAGIEVASAGDVNGDGRPDQLIGAYTADFNSRSASGSAASLGSGGYRIDGAAAGDKARVSLANIGDTNRDGIPDALVSAYQADNDGRVDNGSIYVIFGKSSTSTIDLGTLGTQGYRIDGGTASDNAGRAVADAGDVNGDGRDDFLITARLTNYNGRTGAGSTYIITAPTCT